MGGRKTSPRLPIAVPLSAIEPDKQRQITVSATSKPKTTLAVKNSYLNEAQDGFCKPEVRKEDSYLSFVSVNFYCFDLSC